MGPWGHLGVKGRAPGVKHAPPSFQAWHSQRDEVGEGISVPRGAVLARTRAGGGGSEGAEGS